MASFVVLEPSGETRASERALFVRDGFHVFAFLVPVLFFAFHRAWLAALAALVVSLGLPAAAGALGFAGAAGALGLLASLWFGLEAGNLRVGALRRRGWRETGVVEADRLAEAEIRYLADVAEDAPAAPAMAMTAQPWGTISRPAAAAGPALGLFGYPGRR